jgi:hypothetical protein
VNKYVMEDMATCISNTSGADDCGRCSALALSLGACWPGTYQFRCVLTGSSCCTPPACAVDAYPQARIALARIALFANTDSGDMQRQ